MKSHLYSHTGEKPFKCKQCLKSYSSSGDLTLHLRTHSGEKTFKCEQCPKSFSQSSHLTSHLQTHTGEKPFKCEQCPKMFRNKRSLTGHLQTHTGEKTKKDINGNEWLVFHVFVSILQCLAIFSFHYDILCHFDYFSLQIVI